jgi:hypothetical protein
MIDVYTSFAVPATLRVTPIVCKGRLGRGGLDATGRATSSCRCRCSVALGSIDSVTAATQWGSLVGVSPRPIPNL